MNGSQNGTPGNIVPATTTRKNGARRVPVTAGARTDQRDSREESGERAEKQSDQIVALLDSMEAEYVRDVNGTAYVVVLENGARVVYDVRSRDLKALLTQAFDRRFGTVPARSALADAAGLFEGRALQGRRVDVAVRVAGDDSAIDIDLGDDRRRMVRVTSEGWSIRPHGDRLFLRTPGMGELPEPAHGGKLSALREFIRVDDDGFALVVAFLLNALRPGGPYPILMLGGEHGSAKTTTARKVRGLIDPWMPMDGAAPSNERDLVIAATNSHVLAFDNLSNISPAMSDALCRVATRGGLRTRRLYTDQSEVLFDVANPIIITSIVDVASRPDLLDRCLTVRLRPIRKYLRERDLNRKFEEAWPKLLGSLLTAVSAALRDRDKVNIVGEAPRMCDAYYWAFAGCVAADVEPETMSRAWGRTRAEAHASTLEESPIAAALQSLVEEAPWQGTATDLLAELAGRVGDATTRRRDWPRSAKMLAGEVRRIAPALRAAGIDHDEEREPRSGQRLHVFSLTNNQDASPSSPPSPMC